MGVVLKRTEQAAVITEPDQRKTEDRKAKPRIMGFT